MPISDWLRYWPTVVDSEWLVIINKLVDVKQNLDNMLYDQ